MTLDDIQWQLHRLLRTTCIFGAFHKNMNEYRPILSARKIRAGTLVFGSRRFMRILAAFSGWGIKRQWNCRQLQWITAILIFKVWNCELLTLLLFAPMQNNKLCKIFHKLQSCIENMQKHEQTKRTVITSCYDRMKYVMACYITKYFESSLCYLIVYRHRLQTYVT